MVQVKCSAVLVAETVQQEPRLLFDKVTPRRSLNSLLGAIPLCPEVEERLRGLGMTWTADRIKKTPSLESELFLRIPQPGPTIVWHPRPTPQRPLAVATLALPCLRVSALLLPFPRS